MGLVSGRPDLLEGYTAQTGPALSRAREVVERYRSAVAAFNAVAPTPLRDLSAELTATIDRLEVLDRIPAAFAAALRQVDAIAVGPTLRVVAGTRLYGLVLARVLNPDATDIEAERLARALGRGEGVEGLSPGQAAALAWAAPQLAGNLNGAPLAVRYEINRRRVAEALAAVDRRLEHGGLTDWERRQLLERRSTLTALLGPGLDGGPRQLLLFDASGDGRAVEVFGDLDSADHVAVVVPGIQNTLGNFDALAQDSLRLHERARMVPGTGGVATVAWLGYDTPGYVDAVLTRTAREAAGELQAFFGGLDLGADVHTTLIGHSYGSLVSATAARNGALDVDELVVLGSPGLGVGSAGQLHLAEGTELYAGRAPGDPVSLSQWHGRDPAGPLFGGQPIATNAAADDPATAADETNMVRGHSAYFTAHSESLDNLARITTGRQEQVTPAEFDPVDPFADALATTVTTPLGDAVRSAEAAWDSAGPALDAAHHHIDDAQAAARRDHAQADVAIDSAQRRVDLPSQHDAVIDAGQATVRVVHLAVDGVLDSVQASMRALHEAVLDVATEENLDRLNDRVEQVIDEGVG